VQVLHVREGRVVGHADYSFSGVRIDDGEALSSFLAQFYAEDAGRPLPRKLLLSVALPDEEAMESFLKDRAGGKVTCAVPLRGEHKKLTDMAMANARLRLVQRTREQESLLAVCAELQERLSLPVLPRHIECYDVSNLMGTYSVASRVVFKDGEASKVDYRHYRIREAQGGDDVGCMREVLSRRFDRMDEEPLPDLLMLDGGKAQLGVAVALLRDRGIDLPALGLAKEVDTESPSPRVKRGGGLKAERVFLPGRKDAIFLPPNSKGMLLLQRLRDESHRFAIEYQRSLRRKASMTSILEEIPGVGPGKRKALLRALGSLRAVRQASVEKLMQVQSVSAENAHAVRQFFDQLDEQKSEQAPESLAEE
jgi:excinuclease ABC subunit C